MEEILVTGACGFLGRHVARRVARDGYLVRGIGHGRWPEDEWKRWGLTEWCEADVNLKSLRQYAGTPYAVIHCAGSGSVSFSVERPWEDFQRTVATTLDLLEYTRVFSPGTRVVYPSSASVYGTAATSPIAETCPHSPISPYGVHKSIVELLISTYAGRFGTSASIVRLFSVYGCGLRKQLLWDACRKFAARDRVFAGTGAEIRDWLHVEDAAGLLALAALNANPHCQVVNGGTGEGTSVRELLAHCAQSLRLSSTEVQFSGTHRPGDPDRYIANNTQARNWGWVPKRHWREGVAEYCEWWLKEKEDAGSETHLARPI